MPEEILKKDFVLEVLSLYIRGWVETDQIEKILALLAAVDENVPFTILAFFPQQEMRHVSSPTVEQMVSAYEVARATRLRQIRLENMAAFAKTEEDFQKLAAMTPGGW